MVQLKHTLAVLALASAAKASYLPSLMPRHDGALIDDSSYQPDENDYSEPTFSFHDHGRRSKDDYSQTNDDNGDNDYTDELDLTVLDYNPISSNPAADYQSVTSYLPDSDDHDHKDDYKDNGQDDQDAYDKNYDTFDSYKPSSPMTSYSNGNGYDDSKSTYTPSSPSTGSNAYMDNSQPDSSYPSIPPSPATGSNAYDIPSSDSNGYAAPPAVDSYNAPTPTSVTLSTPCDTTLPATTGVGGATVSSIPSATPTPTPTPTDDCDDDDIKPTNPSTPSYGSPSYGSPVASDSGKKEYGAQSPIQSLLYSASNKVDVSLFSGIAIAALVSIFLA